MRSIHILTPLFETQEEAERDLADRILQMFRDGVGGGVAVRRHPDICCDDRGGPFVGAARFATLPGFVKENEDGSVTFSEGPLEDAKDTLFGLADVKDES